MKTVFFESLRYKFIIKNGFYYGSCPDINKIIKFSGGVKKKVKVKKIFKYII